jgi:hypothetical protein
MRILWSFLLLCLLTTSAVGQEIGFTATVDRSSIAAGDQLRLTIQLTNTRERFNAPDLGGLVVVAGPFESSNFSYVNGRMTSAVSRTWTLTATQPGKYTIGPAQVKVGGGIISTDPITIEVTKGAARPSDPYATQGQKSDANLFATITLTKNKVHVGEQVVATYTLYSRYNNLELSKYELPKMTGFWAEEIDLGDNGWEDRPQTINGIPYNVAVLKKQVLFPQKSGKLRIEPLELTCTVNRSFFNRGSQVAVKSNTIELSVSDLPAPAPTDFTGAVGELALTGTIDRTQVKLNEAFEIDLRFTGRTNLKLLESPAFEVPPDLERYDPKTVDKISVNGAGMSGSREFQYLLIPRNEGLFEVPAITLSYFDPELGRYQTLSAGPFQLEVLPGEGGSTARPERPAQTDVQVLGEDIRFIRTGDLHLRPAGDALFGSALYWSGVGIPALAFVLLVGWRRRTEALHGDAALMRRKQAERVAKRTLLNAEKALQVGDTGLFHDAVSKALRGYVGDTLGLGHAELSMDRMRAELSHSTDAISIAEEVGRILGICDMARFAPSNERPDRALYQSALEVIERMERTRRVP